MSEKRLELKVGLFVLIGLILIGALMLYFSKGQSFFQKTYTVYMVTSDVGGLKTKASVLLSGVQVGTVQDITLSPDGRTATVELALLQRYAINKDAKFTIDSLGVLGDQYVNVRPTENKEDRLKEGDIIQSDPPFNFQELARASLGFINRLDQTAQRLNDAIVRIDNMVLNEATLTNLSLAVSNMFVVSERAIGTVESLGSLFTTNAPGLNQAVTNLSKFSEQLNTLADELNETVVTNQTALSRSMDNFERSSFTLREILNDVNAGRGVVGGLVKDEQMKADLERLLVNLNAASSNLTVLGSNINSKGLWAVLWKPKQPKEPSRR